MSTTIKFKQIAIGQWEGSGGLSFMVVGLTEDGRVYKCLKDGWVALGNKPAKTEDQYRSRPSAEPQPTPLDEAIPF